MTADDVTVPAAALSDSEVQRLADTYWQMAQDDSLSKPMRDWYERLAVELQLVAVNRGWSWNRFVRDNGAQDFDWDTAVATLPPDGAP